MRGERLAHTRRPSFIVVYMMSADKRSESKSLPESSSESLGKSSQSPCPNV